MALKIISTALIVLTGVLFGYQGIYFFLPLFFRRENKKPPVPHRFAVLIAARNEEKVLPYLLDSIANQDYPGKLPDVWVIADNCTDRTARIALNSGAHVVERQDTEHVGKGYALQYLLRSLKAQVGFDAYDAYFVFDADNVLSPDYFTEMNKTVSQGYDVFEGYRNSKNFGQSLIASGHALWYMHNCANLNRSRYIVGQSILVDGTGFGFSRRLLQEMDGWHFTTLTEDLEFSVYCATHGYRMGYCHEAILFDEQPGTLRDSVIQRARWVRGDFQVSFKYAADYFRGMFAFGKTGFASLECFAVSMWAFCLGAVTCLFSLLSAAVSGTLPQAIVACLAGSLAIMEFTAVFTLITQRKRIKAPTGRRLLALLGYPLFLYSYVPIAVYAVLKKPTWKAISHTVGLSAQELMKK